MPKAANEGPVPGKCIYATDVDFEGCMYASQVGSMLDVNGAGMPEAAGVP